MKQPQCCLISFQQYDFSLKKKWKRLSTPDIAVPWRRHSGHTHIQPNHTIQTHILKRQRPHKDFKDAAVVDWWCMLSPCFKDKYSCFVIWRRGSQYNQRHFIVLLTLFWATSFVVPLTGFKHQFSLFFFCPPGRKESGNVFFLMFDPPVSVKYVWLLFFLFSSTKVSESLVRLTSLLKNFQFYAFCQLCSVGRFPDEKDGMCTFIGSCVALMMKKRWIELHYHLSNFSRVIHLLPRLQFFFQKEAFQ